MAGYKVSYKVLRKQGEDMKAAAKLVEGYSERIGQISGKLGDDELLAEVRQNLGKLRTQLTESRTMLNTAGELLISSVEGYTGTETKQVKKVDGYRAHNRDFYKNPVAVASVGGAGAAAVGGSATATSVEVTSNVSMSATSVNVTDQSVTIINQTPEPAVSATYETPMTAASPAEPTVTQASSGFGKSAAAAGAIAFGGAVAAAGIRADQKEKKSNPQPTAQSPDVSESQLDSQIKQLQDL